MKKDSKMTYDSLLAFRCGYSRRVILFSRYAFKIARDKNGRRCNIGELHCSTSYTDAPIAKVILSLFNGWLIVMNRCNEIDKDDYESAFKIDNAIRDYNLNAEALPQNVGLFYDRLVLVDYWQ
jgi:hypothetical protein